MARNVPENRQADVYNKVRAASCDGKDAEGWALVGLVSTSNCKQRGKVEKGGGREGVDER